VIAAALIAVGAASWFTPYQRMYDGGHYCAMNVARPGTRVRIIGDRRRSSYCTVIGSGPFVPGRVIDVSPLVRDELQMRDAGVIRVKVYSLASPRRIHEQNQSAQVDEAHRLRREWWPFWRVRISESQPVDVEHHPDLYSRRTWNALAVAVASCGQRRADRDVRRYTDRRDQRRLNERPAP